MEGEHDFTIANAYKNMTVTPYSAPKNHLEVIGTKYFKPQSIWQPNITKKYKKNRMFHMLYDIRDKYKNLSMYRKGRDPLNLINFQNKSAIPKSQGFYWHEPNNTEIIDVVVQGGTN